jgi:hypothetical protein
MASKDNLQNKKNPDNSIRVEGYGEWLREKGFILLS